MPHSLSARLAIAFLLAVSGFAMLKGRAPEKIAGAGLVLDEVLYLAFYHPGDTVNAQWETMWIDLVFAAALAFAAIRYDRAWTKWAAAFQFLAVGIHLASGLDLAISTYIEVWGGALATLSVVWAVLFGTVQVVLEERRAKRLTAAVGP